MAKEDTDATSGGSGFRTGNDARPVVASIPSQDEPHIGTRSRRLLPEARSSTHSQSSQPGADRPHSRSPHRLSQAGATDDLHGGSQQPPPSALQDNGDEGGAQPMAVEPDHDRIKKLVHAAIEKSRDPVLSKHVLKVTQRLASRIDSLQKLNERLKKNVKDIELLGTGVIPSGTKPFSVAYETQLLDSVTVDPEQHRLPDGMNMQLPPGKTIREAKKTCYIQFLLFNAATDKILMNAQRDELRSLTRRDKFVEAILDVPKTIATNHWNILDSDLDDSETPATYDIDKLREKAWSLYSRTVDIAAENKAKAIEKATSDARTQNDAIMKLTQATPTQLFEASVAKAVDKVLDKKGVVNMNKVVAPPPGLDVDHAALYSTLVSGGAINESDVTKNSISPTIGGGTNSRKKVSVPPLTKAAAKPKAKAKAKPKPQPKPWPTSGKGKGKGKGKGVVQPAKGKSRGKGKGNGGKGGRGGPPRQKGKGKGKPLL